jgi:2-hydroxy-6-oxonona-2,4-dienedioate hydrolase
MERRGTRAYPQDFATFVNYSRDLERHFGHVDVARAPGSRKTAPAADAALAKHVDLSRFESGQVDVGGLRMHHRRGSSPAGAATSLVLVHGLGLSGRYMLPTAQALLGGYTVFAPDLPGFGDSDKPDHVLTIAELGDSLASWIRAMRLEPVALLGNSLGCQIIAAALDRHPAVGSAAILQGPTTPPRERRVAWQFLRWRQNLGYDPPDMKTISRDDYLKCGRWRVWKTFYDGLSDAMEERSAHIPQPVLVVRGELDPICRREWARDLTERLPAGRFAEIPGVAHTLVFTAPAELAEVSRRFLDSV